MKNYKKYYKIKAELEDVYACLTNPLTIEIWSGMPTVMETKEGSEFEIFDGSICGRIIKLDENKEVIQEWYFGEQAEESIVKIKLFKDGSHISVELNHTNIPDTDYNDIVEGWNNNYFGAIEEFLKAD